MGEQIPYPPIPPGKPLPEARLTTLQKAEFIRGLELFSRATVEELFSLASITRELDFAAGETIFREHDIGDTLYLVVQGKVELTSQRESFREVVGPRQSFGLYSVLTREPRSATANALEDTFALCIESEDFYNLLSNNMEIVVSIFKHLVQKCDLRS